MRRPATAIRLVALGLAFAAALGAASARAQPAAAPLPGTLVLIAGSAEIEAANDEALASFFHEVQDPDAARAQSLTNQKVGEATAALRRADPTAEIQTSGYSSYPVYSQGSGRRIIGWRVRQGVTLRTANLADLPKTIALAQQSLLLGGIEFRLSKSARQRLESQLIQQAIADLNGRVATVARTLGVPPERVRIEELNFGVREATPFPVAFRRQSAAPASADAVSEPTLEAGKSVERQAVTGKVRLLPP